LWSQAYKLDLRNRIFFDGGFFANVLSSFAAAASDWKVLRGALDKTVFVANLAFPSEQKVLHGIFSHKG
jgi:hypothetical protein